MIPHTSLQLKDQTLPRICSLHVDHSETNRAVGLVLFLGVKVQ